MKRKKQRNEESAQANGRSDDMGTNPSAASDSSSGPGEWIEEQRRPTYEGSTSLEPRAGGQAGSLQGLSDDTDADSESVDELLEEGNAFEAGIIKGVEDAPDADEGEIETQEVPEDDVREEYLDNDK